MLITKESYDPKMENQGPKNKTVKKALKKSSILVSNTSDEEFLTRLQNIHDHFEPYAWAHLFVDFARVEFSMSEKEAMKLVKSLKPVRKVK